MIYTFLFYQGKQDCDCVDTHTDDLHFSDVLLMYSLCSCKLSFHDAESYCSDELGGHLVTVENEETQGFLLTSVLKHLRSDVWIGLEGKLGDWGWTASRSIVQSMQCLKFK